MQLNTNMCTPEERKAIVARIDKMLKQKRYCFWYVRVDSQKQQLVLNAESRVWGVRQMQNEYWVDALKLFSKQYLEPLVGSPNSKYYKHYQQLVTDIQNLK